MNKNYSLWVVNNQSLTNQSLTNQSLTENAPTSDRSVSKLVTGLSDTKEIKKVQKKAPAISSLIVKLFLKEMELEKPDGDYERDNLWPAKNLANDIKTKIEREGCQNPTNENILETFTKTIRAMDDFDKKRATKISYIKNSFNRLYNNLK